MSEFSVYYTYAYCDPFKLFNKEISGYFFEYEPFYIGKGTKNRLNKHLYRARKNNHGGNIDRYKIIKNILNNGKEPIIIKLEKDITEDKAFSTEILLIEKLGRRDINTGILVNHTDGGDGSSGFCPSEETRKLLSEKGKGRKHTEEYKVHMSKIMSGVSKSEEHKKSMSISKKGKKLSLEHRKKLSDVRKGENHPNWGKQLSDETRKKISDGNKGKKVSKESIEKRLNTMGKIIVSDETKRKISESNIGKPKHTLESRKKMSDIRKGKKLPIETVNKIQNRLNYLRDNGLFKYRDSKGSNNSNAKEIKLINFITGEEYIFNGNMKEFCNNRGLNYSELLYSYNNNKERKRGKNYGWKVEYIKKKDINNEN